MEQTTNAVAGVLDASAPVTKRDHRVAADRAAYGTWHSEGASPRARRHARQSYLAKAGEGNRSQRRARAYPRGIGAQYPPGTIRQHGPRANDDHVVRETVTMIQEWPDYADALTHPVWTRQLRAVASRRLADRRHEERRRARRAQRAARRITWARG